MDEEKNKGEDTLIQESFAQMTEQRKAFSPASGLCFPLLVNHCYSSGNTGLKSQSVAAFISFLQYGLNSRRRSLNVRMCAGGFASARSCVSVSSWREKGRRVHGKEAAGTVCARFVCHISACLRLMQMGRGLGGTAPWETAGANPAC